MNSNKLDVYPHNFSEKIGYTEVRHILEGYCASTLGQEEMQRLDEVSKNVQGERNFTFTGPNWLSHHRVSLSSPH